MTKIKIHDAEWFDKHCCPTKLGFPYLRPKGDYWSRLDAITEIVTWIGEGFMHSLAGRALDVDEIDMSPCAAEMSSSKYFAGGYCIPNWAIEWVMEA